MIERKDICLETCKKKEEGCPWKCPDNNFFNCDICTNRCPCCTADCKKCNETECANRSVRSKKIIHSA